MLIPRTRRNDPNIAGLIVMAGTTRPLEDVMLEQIEYLGKDSLGIKEQVSKIKAVKAGDPPVLGAPASYWLDLRDYKPAQSAVELKQPILILQGERDYQVTMQDSTSPPGSRRAKHSLTVVAQSAR